LRQILQRQHGMEHSTANPLRPMCTFTPFKYFVTMLHWFLITET